MIYINQEDMLVIKSWCNAPEEGAVEQARNLARLPFAFRQICLMPDTHQGYGMPIGGVLATKGVVIPNAVGVDIGCGMCAVKTSLTDIDIDALKKIMGLIRERIPVGMNHHKSKQDVKYVPYMDFFYGNDYSNVVTKEYDKSLYSIGTLGGGNHFIEIQKGDDGYIWVMIHSGSRNLGKQVADYYNKVAIDLNEKYFSKVPKEWKLAFLPLDSKEGIAYIEEMRYCVDFAFANRELMINRIQDIFVEVLKDVDFVDFPIDVSHNYARMENHFGENVMVHRKGATSAKRGEVGIIPGSQGTSSYIVQGLGNEESFSSCSHGAGRRMSRTKAINTLNLEEEQEKLNKSGIIHSVRNTKDLDESPGSYKDIDIVMEEQKDLVKPIIKLNPLGVIKG